MPPVNSSKPSTVEPPARASKELFNLGGQRIRGTRVHLHLQAQGTTERKGYHLVSLNLLGHQCDLGQENSSPWKCSWQHPFMDPEGAVDAEWEGGCLRMKCVVTDTPGLGHHQGHSQGYSSCPAPYLA